MSASHGVFNACSHKLPVNSISLRFIGEAVDLEDKYIEYEHGRNLWHLRFVMLMGVFLYSIYYILDLFIAPGFTAEFAVIRLGIVSPFVLIMVFLTFLPNFKKIVNYVMVSCVLVASGGYITMSVLATTDIHLIYLIGVLVCMIFNYGFIRLPFIYTIATGIFISGVYSIVQLQWGAAPVKDQFVFLISFLSVQPVLATIAYTTERANRKSFYLMNILTQQHKEIESINSELKDALDHVKQLGGLIPICAKCKNIRDDKGYWNQIESYISEHSEAEFSHSICPDCASKLYPEYQNESD